MIIPNHRIFTFVEQIGPFMCEHYECRNQPGLSL